MKKIFYVALSFVALCMSSCGSSKKVEAPKSPISTYEMPCADMISGDGMLRVWAMGRSDNEATARKKARANAAAELGAILSKTVQSTTEDYSAALTEGMDAASKSYFNEKVKITVNKTVSGAVIVCDQWHKDEQTGLFTNYIVMELSGEEYLKSLYKELGQATTSTINKQLLEELFIKHINSSADSAPKK